MPIYRRDDQVAQKDRWMVSADGQQMTLTTTGTLETGQQLGAVGVSKAVALGAYRQGHGFEFNESQPR